MFRTRIFRVEGRWPWARDPASSRASTPRKSTVEPRRLGPQSGFTLAGLLVILTIITVFVAYTVPRQWSMATARERDQQTLFAMKQYARAIRAFQEKNKSVPVSLDQLKQARNPRLMRGSGELIDPLTGKVDWIPVPASAVQQQGGAQTLPPGVAPNPGATPSAANPNGGMIIGYRGAPPPAAVPPPVMNTGEQPQPGSPGGAVGPLVGVRPNKSGTSYLTLNGSDSYERWLYTTADLDNEINTRRNALMVK